MTKRESEKEDTKDAVKARPLHRFSEMEKYLDEYLQRGWFRPFPMKWPAWEGGDSSHDTKTPKVDVIDRDDEVVIKAELPGVDKKDIDVSVTNNTVIIKGHTSHEEKEEKGDYCRCEITRGSFQRTMALPSNVDEENAKASFKNGILKLRLPKVKKSRRNKVEID